jgi:membrane protein
MIAAACFTVFCPATPCQMTPQLANMKPFLLFVWKQFEANQCLQSAAMLAFTTLFAIVPMMTVSYAVLSLVPDTLMPQHDALSRHVETFIFGNLMPDTGMQVWHYLDQFSQQASRLTLPGIVMLVITSLMMLRTIEDTFNSIWHVQRGRRAILGLLRHWAVLSLGPVLLGTGILFSTFVASLDWFDGVEKFKAVQPLARLLPLFLTSSALCLIYLAVPNCRVPFRHAVTGALLAGVTFEIAKFIFAQSVIHSSYTLIYGAFAFVPLFLLWIDICWMIVLAGAVLVRSFAIYSPDQASTSP